MTNQQASRRSFLQKATYATIGLTALTATHATANIFESKSHLPDYNPYAPQTTDLRKAFSSAKTVKVQGTITDKLTMLPIANAKIEVWHISPDTKKVGHRAYFYTDASGHYAFVTDFPHGEQGITPLINFRITSSDSEENTQLLLGQSNAHIDGNHWVRQQKYNNNLFPVMTKTTSSVNIEFSNVI